MRDRVQACLGCPTLTASGPEDRRPIDRWERQALGRALNERDLLVASVPGHGGRLLGLPAARLVFPPLRDVAAGESAVPAAKDGSPRRSKRLLARGAERMCFLTRMPERTGPARRGDFRAGSVAVVARSLTVSSIANMG